MSPASQPCKPCLSRGNVVAATRVMNNGTAKCERCYLGNVEVLKPIGSNHPETHGPAAAQSPINSESKETLMPPKKEIDWIAVQNERSDGVSVAQLAKKYGVSSVTIYARTKKPANGGGYGEADEVARAFAQAARVRAGARVG